MYRKNCCTTPGVKVGGGVSVDKTLKFYIKVFCDGQGIVRGSPLQMQWVVGSCDDAGSY